MQCSLHVYFTALESRLTSTNSAKLTSPRKTYTPEHLDKAIKDVMKFKVTPAKASRDNNVPPSTLSYNLKNKQLENAKNEISKLKREVESNKNNRQNELI